MYVEPHFIPMKSLFIKAEPMIRISRWIFVAVVFTAAWFLVSCGVESANDDVSTLPPVEEVATGETVSVGAPDPVAEFPPADTPVSQRSATAAPSVATIETPSVPSDTPVSQKSATAVPSVAITEDTATPENTPTASPADTLPDPTATPRPERDLDIVTLLAPDAIPSIDTPTFFNSLDDANEVYRDTELVLGIEIDGDARAYSVPLLSRHEIVNDVVGGKPVAVTW